MYGMEYYTTINTLYEQGKSKRQIALSLGVHRKVVNRVIKSVEKTKRGEASHLAKASQRFKQLSGHEERIKNWVEEDVLSSELIHQRLIQDYGLKVSYATVNRCARQFRPQVKGESFVPMHSALGEEAQVDFGYLGLFQMPDGSSCKIWVFCMVLARSRYGYYEVVRDQKQETFLRCHRNAFEYFQGVPKLVRLDNLKSGVTTPDFYEPLIQKHYASFWRTIALRRCLAGSTPLSTKER